MSQAIGIDFGSTFTKIALREDWNAAGTLAKFPEYGRQADAQICVPTIVCESRRGKNPEWIFGKDAAALRPGEKLTIYKNWKTHFVNPQIKPNSGLLTAAGKFFTWLRSHCAKSEVLKHHLDVPVRLCVPDFDRLGVWETWLRAILCTAGWNCKDEFLITEPYANLIGTLTCGRNAVWTPPKGRHGTMSVSFGRMFDTDSGLLGGARQAILSKSRKSFAALIVDVGAYTTDCGLVRWEDLAEFELSPDKVHTKSYETGVKDLDGHLVNAFDKECGQLLNAMSFADFEMTKLALLNGREHAIVVSGKQRILGQGLEMKSVEAATRRFSSDVVECIDKFLKEWRITKVNTVVLTGGGTLIPGVNQHLKNRFAGAESQVIDLSDEVFANSKLDMTLKREERMARNRLLVRGGSAVGGSSVYFDSKSGVIELG